MEQPILNGLITYNAEGCYPWHMPGHKKRLGSIFPDQVSNPLLIDATEVGDLDELHHPEGIIKDALTRASEVYGSNKSYYLVNGSTCGILAAISAVCKQGDTLIVARNCHKSVYHAIRLLRLKPIYICPDWNEGLGMFGGLSPELVKKTIKEHPFAKAVIMVSPTYEGVVSDVEKISKISHKYKIPVIVDAAHGAHFEFMAHVSEAISTTDYNKVPDPAIRLGADIVLESLHKTLPAMTQCAICHIKSNLVSTERLEEFLSIYQSTSPSYVFMASMEACIEKMDHERDGLCISYKHLLAEYRKKFEQLKHIHLVKESDFKKNNVYDYDDGKLVFSVADCGILQDDRVVPFTGTMLGTMLAKEYGQMMEMAAGSYVIAMTSIADSKEAFEALYQAIEAIDGQLTIIEKIADSNKEETTKVLKKRKKRNKMSNNDSDVTYARIPERRMGIAEAKENAHMNVSFMEAAGRVSGDYVYVYPPGIPIITPGEVFSREIIREIEVALKSDLNVKGVIRKGKQDLRLCVLKEARWRSKLFNS